REDVIRAATTADDAEDRLRRLIIDPADQSLWRTRIDPIEEPTGRGPLPDVDAAVASALHERYDLARAGHELENAATTVEFLGNQKLPDVRLEAAESVRRPGRQVRSAAERTDAARAGATLAQERFDVEQRRFEVGLSTTFLVTQAQRDLLQAQVNLLQTTLDYESSLVSFEAVQQAPPLAAGDTVAVRGANIVVLPTPAPRGLFRQGAGG